MSDAVPAISVIVPLFRPWEATEKLWESLERQTIPFELIIVNGSQGAPRARNRGAAVAHGDLLFFCDQDIELHPSCLSSLADALRESPTAGYAYCDYDRSGALEGLWLSRPFSASSLRWRNTISTCSMIRKSLFPGFDESLERFQDWDLWLTLLNRGIRGTYVPRVLFTAHYRPGDISTDATTEERWYQRVLAKHQYPPPAAAGGCRLPG